MVKGFYRLLAYVANTSSLVNACLSGPLHKVNHPFMADLSAHQAIEIAIGAAKPLLEGFISEFKLSKAQQKSRKVDPGLINASMIPVAHDNASRGAVFQLPESAIQMRLWLKCPYNTTSRGVVDRSRILFWNSSVTTDT